MTDQLQVLRLVINRLETAAIPYMLSGSLAMNYYGEPRMTRDIDLVVALHLPDVDRMFALFKEDFYCDEETMRRAVHRRTLFNLIHFELVVKVDVIVQQDDTYRRTEFARRQRITLDDVPVWIVAIEDLVLSKLLWAKKGESTLQLQDAHNPRLVRASHGLGIPRTVGGRIDSDSAPATGAATMTNRLDTLPAAAEVHQRLMMQRSGTERFLMGCEMFSTSRALVCAGIRDEGRSLTSAQLKVALFLRTYGRDFDSVTTERIASRLHDYFARQERA